ncbi:hypothetical protein [Erwinia sorbitola]|uniref:Uncharacterized protein n=1 Tax=Erwinia sorbitola TaxID=2681984 RepID=A0A6I6EZ98_9GAMM|nr:hypothetical protein [Erwinia sorbitola]QGU86970.1 hypothetical protein GN242_06970 [Erwinia sorbitola]
MIPSVIDFIVMHQNEIGVVLCLCLILNGVISVVHNRVTKDKFITLCSLFVDKFGTEPAEVLIYKNGGSFFSFMRDAFFIKALYFKENSFYTREMDNEQIRFIKELPNQYTDWLRIKARLSIIGIVLLFMMLSVFYLPPFI